MSTETGIFAQEILKELKGPVTTANQYDGMEHDNRVRQGHYDILNDRVRPTGKRMIEKVLGK